MSNKSQKKQAADGITSKKHDVENGLKNGKSATRENEKEHQTSQLSKDEVILETEESAVEKLMAENERLRDQMLRAAAEFENYKKRRASDLTQMSIMASEDFIVDLLPVLDDLELMIKNSKNSKDFDALIQGAELIRQKLSDLLKKRGVEVVEAEGQLFNPDLHEALLQLPSADVEPDTVLEVHQKGYKLGGKLLRPSRVIISTTQE